MRAAGMALAAFVLCACAKSGARAGDSSAAGGADTTRADAAVAKVRDDWAEGSHTQNAVRVASLYSEDAVMVGSDQPLASGRSSIEAALAKAFPNTHGLKINSENTDASGNLAYDFGTYSELVQPPGGKETIVGGAYLVVLKKQSDGSWKIVRHVTVTPPKG